jgi:hypothetical protein
MRLTTWLRCCAVRPKAEPVNGANPGNNFGRLFGKAGSPHRNEVDCGGQSIFFPRFARTWAGSLALGASSHSPSQPSLALGNTIAGSGPVTVENIAQALANSAAHEIGHLFGLTHPQCGPTGACANERLMFTVVESIEATHDKSFDAGETDALRAAIGPRPLLSTVIPGAVVDTGTGLMYTRDARLPRTVAVGDIVPQSDGRMGFFDGHSYASGLDFLGYNDWRLPTALEPDGSGPCFFRLAPVGLDGLTVVHCDGSELGRLNFFPPVPGAASPFLNFTFTTYWSTPLTSPTVFTFGLGEQFPASLTGVTAAQVWPVRHSARLIDNGDGTVTDTFQHLMWIRDPGPLLPRTLTGAQTVLPHMFFAGHGGWRLPRIPGSRDRNCDDVGLFNLESTSSTGCVLNELARLREGWAVTPGAPTPFVLPTGAVWLDNPVIAINDQSGVPIEVPRPVTYDFATGALTVTSVDTQAAMFAVREILPGEVAKGHNVIVEPDHDVVVRFKIVTTAGQMLFDHLVTSPDTFAISSRNLFRLGTSASFDASATDALVVCLRYVANEISGVPDATLRVGQVQNGVLRALPLVEGYPDAVNHVVCGQTRSLGDFRLMSTASGPFPF